MLHEVKKLKSNGTLKLDLGWRGAFRKLEVEGGPYDAYRPTRNSYGVCVRKEYVPKGGFDTHLAIEDFKVPTHKPAVDQALKETFEAMLDGRQVYVGCMGGWGRTGMFLALMAKVAGQSDPVKYVKKTYAAKAVETLAQAMYVDEFDVTEVRRWLMKTAWRKWLLDKLPW